MRKDKVFCCDCYYYNNDNSRGPGACEFNPKIITYGGSERPYNTEKIRVSVDTRNHNNDCVHHRVPVGFKEKFKMFFNMKR
jgi:hypothetical protein